MSFQRRENPNTFMPASKNRESSYERLKKATLEVKKQLRDFEQGGATQVKRVTKRKSSPNTT